MYVLTFTLVAAALAIVYCYVKYLNSYWKRRGIPYLRPSFPFGNFGKTFLKKLPMGMQIAELYHGTAEPFIGIFMLQSPMLLIRDPKLIRRILITDFQHFTDRNHYLNEKSDPMSGHLGALHGQRWRDLRGELTSAFTPNKMKTIFSDLLNCGNQLQSHLTDLFNAGQDIEICEIAACFASNIVGSAAFGIDVDCLANPNHPFRTVGRKLFEVNIKNALRFLGWLFQPAIIKWSGIRFVDRDTEEYFNSLATQIMEIRKQTNAVRNDFFQVLVELHNAKSLTIEQVTAQVFTFYFAGIEPSALTIAYFMYEIAKNPEIQQKIHAEIDDVMAQRNGQLLSYESINELKYLDCCIEETFRKYESFDLSRKCVKDYKIPGTNVTIGKGTSIIIPTFAIHNDEKFYFDPEKFDPMRFSIENKAGKSIIDRPYLIFGDGPRQCMGQRMGKIFVKIGVCSILQHFHVELDDRHIGRELRFSVNLHPVDGIHLKLKAK